jgi:hypothetical protein
VVTRTIVTHRRKNRHSSKRPWLFLQTNSLLLILVSRGLVHFPTSEVAATIESYNPVAGTCDVVEMVEVATSR